MNRKQALAALTVGTVGTALQLGFPRCALGGSEPYEVHLTEAQWRKRLRPEQYAILREHGTEPPFTSPLDGEKRRGTYFCAGCGLALFKSQTKFDSHTGWPSFYAPIRDAVRTSSDKSLFESRTEVHCRRCAGHLGHLFTDGPKPTGLRYCMDGLALNFKRD
ncbi:MAG: peptide-methionine (R)-S-oxide reductase MsrB [Candidatus Eremiobacteraeota bacterium]|nr:peptide-methionine (R)-S-oxide reductase MsrB [Candidatus Eremiobacteraeota bacterium]